MVRCLSFLSLTFIAAAVFASPATATSANYPAPSAGVIAPSSDPLPGAATSSTGAASTSAEIAELLHEIENIDGLERTLEKLESSIPAVPNVHPDGVILGTSIPIRQSDRSLPSQQSSPSFTPDAYPSVSSSSSSSSNNTTQQSWPINLFQKEFQSHHAIHTHPITGKKTTLKYTVKPAQNVYHFHPGMNIHHIYCNHTTNWMNITLKRSGESLLSNGTGTLHDDAKHFPLYELPIGTIIVMEANHCGCMKTQNSSSSASASQFPSGFQGQSTNSSLIPSILRRLLQPLPLYNISSNQSSLQIQTEDADWKSVFEEGTMHYVAEDINSLLPGSLPVIPSNNNNGAFDAVASTSSGMMTPSSSNYNSEDSSTAAGAPMMMKDTAVADDVELSFGNPFAAITSAVSSAASAVSSAASAAVNATKTVASNVASTVASTVQTAVNTTSTVATQVASTVATDTQAAINATVSAAQTVGQYAVQVANMTEAELLAIWGNGTIDVPTPSLFAGWNYAGGTTALLKSIPLYTNDIMTVTCNNCYVGVTLGLEVAVTWSLTDTRNDGGAINVSVIAPAHFEIVAQLKNSEQFMFTQPIATIPIFSQKLLFTLGPVPIIAGCDFKVSANEVISLKENAVLSLSGIGFQAELQAKRGVKWGGMVSPGATANASTVVEDVTMKSFNFNLLTPVFQWQQLTQASATATSSLIIAFEVQIEALTQFTLTAIPYVSAGATYNLVNGTAIGCPNVTDNLSVALTTGVSLSVLAQIKINLDIWSLLIANIAHVPLPNIGPFSLASFCTQVPLLPSGTVVTPTGSSTNSTASVVVIAPTTAAAAPAPAVPAVQVTVQAAAAATSTGV